MSAERIAACAQRIEILQQERQEGMSEYRLHQAGLHRVFLAKRPFDLTNSEISGEGKYVEFEYSRLIYKDTPVDKD
jgi:hypothetical protein